MSTTHKRLVEACRKARVKVQPLKKSTAGKAADKVKGALSGKKEKDTPDPAPPGETDQEGAAGAEGDQGGDGGK